MRAWCSRKLLRLYRHLGVMSPRRYLRAFGDVSRLSASARTVDLLCLRGSTMAGPLAIASAAWAGVSVIGDASAADSHLSRRCVVPGVWVVGLGERPLAPSRLTE
jgi:hypothetical protein